MFLAVVSRPRRSGLLPGSDDGSPQRNSYGFERFPRSERGSDCNEPFTNASFQGGTSDLGEYRLLLLPGPYDIKVEHPGFHAQNAKSVWLTVGEEVVMNFRVAIRSGELAVAVTAAVSPLDSHRTQTSNTVDASVLMNLPVDRRNLLAFVYLLPESRTRER